MKGGGVLSDNYNNEHIPQRPVKKSRKKSKGRTAAFYDKDTASESSANSKTAGKRGKNKSSGKKPSRAKRIIKIVLLAILALVLEVVGVDFAVLYHVIGHHVVAVFLHLQGPAVLGQDLGGGLQDFGVGGGGGGHGDDLLALTAAGGQAQNQGQAQDNCKYFLHNNTLLF